MIERLLSGDNFNIRACERFEWKSLVLHSGIFQDVRQDTGRVQFTVSTTPGKTVSRSRCEVRLLSRPKLELSVACI